MNNLQTLQKWMKKNNVNIFLVNRTDEFLNENIAPYAERLKWISNFSGSAGRAIILQNNAIIFVDERYIIQAHQEINRKYFEIKNIKLYWYWFKNKITSKTLICIDPFLHNNLEIKKIIKKKSKIKFLEKNPIDKLWKLKPSYPKRSAFIHNNKYAGKSISKKLKTIQLILKKKSIDYYLLSSLDSIAWLLNIRGSDVKFTPLIFSYVIIPSKGKVKLFVDKKKIKKIRKKLEKNINFFSINKIREFFFLVSKKSIIGMDEKQTPYYYKMICKKLNKKTIYFSNPCDLPKAQKNNIELIGARKANIRDGVSVTKFLYWLKNKMKIQNTDEIKASRYLYNLRKKNKLFHSLSFDTISAIGKNAALPHYKVTNNSNLSFKKNSIYLFDSGAQYYDGTTDLTRTICIGTPSIEQKDRFTRVLKGHIAVATAKFNKNSKGWSLDRLARKSLQEIGYDYGHGTGHGVGSFLSVHEGPQSITKKNNSSKIGIKEGMILSNEPGFYKKNQYGVRIENLMTVHKKNKNILFFKTISLVPIDIDLIKIELLTKNEIAWINKYHNKVYKTLARKIDPQESKWLKEVTKPIKKNN